MPPGPPLRRHCTPSNLPILHVMRTLALAGISPAQYLHIRGSYASLQALQELERYLLQQQRGAEADAIPFPSSLLQGPQGVAILPPRQDSPVRHRTPGSPIPSKREKTKSFRSYGDATEHDRCVPLQQQRPEYLWMTPDTPQPPPSRQESARPRATPSAAERPGPSQLPQVNRQVPGLLSASVVPLDDQWDPLPLNRRAALFINEGASQEHHSRTLSSSSSTEAGPGTNQSPSPLRPVAQLPSAVKFAAETEQQRQGPPPSPIRPSEPPPPTYSPHPLRKARKLQEFRAKYSKTARPSPPQSPLSGGTASFSSAVANNGSGLLRTAMSPSRASTFRKNLTSVLSQGSSTTISPWS